MTGSLGWLAIAMAVFVGSHFLLSSRPVRGVLVDLVSEPAFLGFYSALAGILLVWVGAAYNAAPYVPLWLPGTGFKHLTLTLMLIAALLVVLGLTTASPTTVAPAANGVDAPPKGINAVTRHPVMWGFAVWGVAHLLANGDAASMILFGGMTFLALAGAAHIDLKRKQALAEAWETYRRRTSYWPFAAMRRGEARLLWREIGLWRLALAIAVYAALIAIHPWLFGVKVWPL